MVLIQVNLSKEENKIVEIYKALNECQDKRTAIKKIIADQQKRR
jgi:hypothetical protein